MAQEKNGTETDGCTFKPKILNKKFAGKQDPEQAEPASSGNKWMELYQQAAKKRNIDRRNLDKDEADLQKDPENYTFRPNAHKKAGGQTQRNGSP